MFNENHSQLENFYRANIKSISEFLDPLGVGKERLIKIPAYQRPYTWKEENFQQFFEDISTAFNALQNRAHSSTFIGAIIALDKQEGTNSYFAVVDGQQRITTLVLTLIFLQDILIKHFEKFSKLGTDIEKTIDEEDDVPSELTELFNSLSIVMEDLKSVIKTLQKGIGVPSREAKQHFRAKSVYWSYPRVVRQDTKDNWSHLQGNARYKSPVANLEQKFLSYSVQYLAAIGLKDGGDLFLDEIRLSPEFKDFKKSIGDSFYKSFWESNAYKNFQDISEYKEFDQKLCSLREIGLAALSDDETVVPIDVIIKNNSHFAKLIDYGTGEVFSNIESVIEYFKGEIKQKESLVQDLEKQGEEYKRINNKVRLPRTISVPKNLALEQLKNIRQNLRDFRMMCKTWFFSLFLLKRVGVTVVDVIVNGVEFDLFQALNTTGEPLTALETFKPSLMTAYDDQTFLEATTDYPARESFEYVEDQIKRYVAGKTGNDVKQKTTASLITSFAAAETGDKIGSSLRLQRDYLNSLLPQDEEKFGQTSTIKQLDEMMLHMKSLSSLLEECWLPERAQLPQGVNPGENVELCFKFLKDINHGLMKAVLLRYWHQYQKSQSKEHLQEFVEAVKASVAFAVLWRGAQGGGTAGIEDKIREMLRSDKDKAPKQAGTFCLNRQFLAKHELDLPSASELKAQYRQYLDNANIGDKSSWAASTSKSLYYGSGDDVIRFILLAAMHNVVPDSSEDYLGSKGQAAGVPLLDYNYWYCTDSNSIEHVAPQNPKDINAWDPLIYEKGENRFNRLGNLTLLPQNINSKIGNKDWSYKRKIYATWSSEGLTKDDMIQELKNLGLYDKKKEEKFNKLFEKSAIQRHLKPLVNVEKWNVEVIDKRGLRLAELAWDQLYPWIKN